MKDWVGKIKVSLRNMNFKNEEVSFLVDYMKNVSFIYISSYRNQKDLQVLQKSIHHFQEN